MKARIVSMESYGPGRDEGKVCFEVEPTSFDSWKNLWIKKDIFEIDVSLEFKDDE